MKLTTRARYGTRAVLDLALNHGKGPVFLQDIAKNQNISQKYLQNLFQSLKSAGILLSVRGAHGGFVLARKPEEIRLSEVIPVLEGPLSLVDCVDNGKACKATEDCVTRELWRKLSEAMMQVLESTTLADLAEKVKQKATKVQSSFEI